MIVTVYDYYMGAIMPSDYEKCGIKVTSSPIWSGNADLEIKNVREIEKTGDVICIHFENADGHLDYVDIETNDFRKMELYA